MMVPDGDGGDEGHGCAYDLSCAGLLSMRDGLRVAGTGPTDSPEWKAHCDEVHSRKPMKGDAEWKEAIAPFW